MIRFQVSVATTSVSLNAFHINGLLSVETYCHRPQQPAGILAAKSSTIGSSSTEPTCVEDAKRKGKTNSQSFGSYSCCSEVPCPRNGSIRRHIRVQPIGKLLVAVAHCFHRFHRNLHISSASNNPSDCASHLEVAVDQSPHFRFNGLTAINSIEP